MKKTLKLKYAKDRAAKRTLLPIVALGGGLAAVPAAALELGELTVQSNLGQPLRASIAYALAPNEMLGNTCVSVGGGRSTGDLPGIGRNTVTITDSAILITGESLIREPMMATRVTINCPYTPNLSREYMLFVDPAGVAETQVAAATPAATPVVESAPRPVARTTRQTRTVDTTPIGQATRYQARHGDTLSDIVSRIENRSMSLWPAVNTIFAANPDAFIDNDPNKLKAGAWLSIPSLDGTAPVVSAAAPAATPAVEAATVPPVQMIDGAVYEPPILEDTAEPVVDEAAAGATAATDAATDEAVEASTGAVVVESDNPFVEPGTTITIPDTELEGPTTTSDSPNVPTAIISTGSRNESTSMLAWFIGGGLAIFGLLVLFGRRIRDRFSSTPDAAAAVGTGLYEDAGDDYDIEDDSPTEENLALDADLVLGTGLTDGEEMDVAQDFGFASPTDVDIELPFEPQPEDNASEGLPPPRDKAGSILESEILPQDDDYEMSVILDATEAPQFGSDDSPTDQYTVNQDVSPTDEYTINEDVADILEKDYEEELTATQALNKEIERAAAELAETIDEEETSEMPLADISELDETSEMPLADDTVETVSEPALDETAAVTVNMSADDETAEMQVANDDETTEMDISGGKIDTKKR